jgi:penicillin-binding protein 2
MSVVVEHGTFGARAAAPIARDVMTFLFDPAAALAALHALEQAWGGTPSERMETRYKSFVSQYGTTAPKVGDEEAVKAAISKADEAQAPIETPATAPATTRAEEPVTPPPSPAPATTPSPGPSPTLAPQ